MVPVYEAGEADGVLYIAMRYVEGTDLRALVDARRARWRPSARRGSCAQVAAALDAAHAPRARAPRRQAGQRADRQEGDEHAYLTDFGLTKHAARRQRR